ncbi:hypothetical protein PG999_004094 [Apiospora kogelbergensis]|uniref:Uncharacterized protein n=1 Tax=Apiospora kogelbergensis TaxID=1337665 RepID=A0AAW0R5H9_9PEZI
MAPLSMISLLARQQSEVSSQIRAQWAEPSDIMSLLMLVGADVVKGALAQQTGGSDWLPPPVVFSFGWVSYSFSAILAAIGNKTFLPAPELPALVLSTEWGYHRVNSSWVISRLLRDFEEFWMPAEVKARLVQMMAEAGGRRRRRVGLCVSVFEASPDKQAGVPDRDLLWYSGYAVAALQLAVAAIPWALYGAWEEFAVTAFGTALAFLTASLPHWTQERWSCSRDSRKTFVLTRGNGAQHAVVIIGAGRGLDLEDLATSSEGLPGKTGTPIMYSGLAVLWCILLITVCGIENLTWFLLAVGTIGMIHTIIVAGAPRQPGLFGIHLRYRDVFAQPKVMKTLQELEMAYPGCGRSMIKTFFPGDLHEEEKLWWQAAKKREDTVKKGEKESVLGDITTSKLEDSSGSSILSCSSAL